MRRELETLWPQAGPLLFLSMSQKELKLLGVLGLVLRGGARGRLMRASSAGKQQQSRGQELYRKRRPGIRGLGEGGIRKTPKRSHLGG